MEIYKHDRAKKFEKALFFFMSYCHLYLVKSITKEADYTFYGFNSTSLNLQDVAVITPEGLLQLTNNSKYVKGHAFYPTPLDFKAQSDKVHSFSTTFVFAFLSPYPDISSQGIAFFISPTTDFSSSLTSEYLGLFNSSNEKPFNQIFAIELDTVRSPNFLDISENHVGIDINSLISISSKNASYFDDATGLFEDLKLASGLPMQVWVDYSGEEMQLNVTLSPVHVPKPKTPLLSSTIDLSSLMLNSMYVGFSSSTGSVGTSHYILGWRFKMNGIVEPLDYNMLPSLPPNKTIPSLPPNKTKDSSNILAIWLPIASCFITLSFVIVIVLIVRRRMKYSELLEDWETQYGPHRFTYKDLFLATKGFKEKELLGNGGFGYVYRGVLPSSNIAVAVKKISHDSRQGLKEFVAEIVSIGQLRHRNLVQLLGYCRRKKELLLVYDFMPNGSLDKLIYDQNGSTLTWAQRFKIIRGVASGLLYLHEDWEQVVLHRDIKASNVLLDDEYNGRLGDFGLARLYDHGSDPHTTHIVGTMGYLAPELTRTGKATTLTDVFAFGVFLLEVACGRRPIERQAQGIEIVIMDWVLESWRRGSLIDTLDLRVGQEYHVYEVELVLKLGLLCSHPVPAVRPTMRRVMQILEGSIELPELSPSSFSAVSQFSDIGFDDYIMSHSSLTFSSLSSGR